MTPEKAQELLDAATPGPWEAPEGYGGGVRSTALNWVAKARWSDGQLIAAAPELAQAYIDAAARVERVRKLIYASDDGTKHEHNGHAAHEGEAECPGCWAADILRAADIRRALDGDA